MLLSQPIWDLMIFSVGSIGSHGVFFSVYFKAIAANWSAMEYHSRASKLNGELLFPVYELGLCRNALLILKFRQNLDVIVLDFFVCTSSIHHRFRQLHTSMKFPGIVWGNRCIEGTACSVIWETKISVETTLVQKRKRTKSKNRENGKLNGTFRNNMLFIQTSFLSLRRN